jgi:hypothetical protein
MRRAMGHAAGAVIIVAMELAMCLAPPARSATRTPVHTPARPVGGLSGTVVSYRGLRLRVPTGWPIHRLDADPGRCVRFDRHAVYLGRGGADQDCPARLAGRTEAVHVEPMDPAAAPTEGRTGGEIRRALPAADLTITATYGARPAVVRQIIGSVRLDPRPRLGASSRPGPPVRSGPPPLEPPARFELPARLEPPARVRAPRGNSIRARHYRARAGRVERRAWVAGRGFDTCAAPSLPAMRAWRRVYRIANIYIGGAARACGDGNLSKAWIKTVRRMGYRLIPTYVGMQAPCTTFHRRFTVRTAARAGAAAADGAFRRARALGIGRAAPIYFDMEAYDSRKGWCRAAVLRFLHRWSRRMRVHRYSPGVYSSVASGIRDLGLARGISKPSSIWFAHWDRRATTARNRFLLDSWWRRHRRIKQYLGPHRERHGGYTINVDSDVVDGRVL